MNGLDDAHADAVAEDRRASLPWLEGALTGLVVGGVLPLIVSLPILLIGTYEMRAVHQDIIGLLLPVAGGGVAAILGVGIGLFDAPGRIAAALARRESPVAMLVMSQVAGALLGMFWMGIAGACTAIAAGLVLVFLTPMDPDMILAQAVLGWILGVLLGTPSMLMHATARALCVSGRSPRFVPVLVAGATAVGTVFWLYWLLAMLGGVLAHFD